MPKRQRQDVVRGLLSQVGLSARMSHRPSELSGGERQRVAIARSVVNGPQMLLADEPTGALDSVTGDRIVQLLFGLCEANGMALVVVTHDPTLAAQFPRVIRLRDGLLVSDTACAEPHGNGEVHDGPAE